MWYFSWALGVSFAISFSILNALWLEQQEASGGEVAGGARETRRENAS